MTKFCGWNTNKICYYLISFSCSFERQSEKYGDWKSSTDRNYEFAARNLLLGDKQFTGLSKVRGCSRSMAE